MENNQLSVEDGALVFAFGSPHRIGSICGATFCEQCGGNQEDGLELVDQNGDKLPPTAMFIIKEATIEDWKQAILRDGGVPDYHDDTDYYYFVSVD